MENNKLVSVIIPIYNAKDYLKVAIQSVLGQTYKNWELIMVDDGSTDNSASIAKKYTDNKKIFLLQHPNGMNKGVATSRALAIRFSKGEYISFLDADDYYTPLKIDKCLNVLNENKGVILVHSAANFIDSSQKKQSFFNEFKFDKINTPYNFLTLDFLNNNHICNSSVVVKSKYVKLINNSFSHLFQYEDWINWILLAEYGNYFYLNEVLCNYRFHEDSSTYKLLKHQLKTMYAKLEMLLILQERIKNNIIKESIQNALNDQLKAIKTFYNTNPEIEVEDIITPLPLKYPSILKLIEKKRIKN